MALGLAFRFVGFQGLGGGSGGLAHPTCRKSHAGRMSGNLKGGPAHYRLSRATWDIILDEYRKGATVPELSERWRRRSNMNNRPHSNVSRCRSVMRG